MENDIITFDEFKKLDIYKDFLNSNPDLGYLKIKAFTAEGAIPIPNTEVIITKDIGSYKVVFYRGETNKDGIIPSIVLPAPHRVAETSADIPQYTLYEMDAIHLGYESIKQYSIGMLGNIKVIQYVKMVPVVEVINND